MRSSVTKLRAALALLAKLEALEVGCRGFIFFSGAAPKDVKICFVTLIAWKLLHLLQWF